MLFLEKVNPAQWKLVFTCKNRIRYGRERTLQSLVHGPYLLPSPHLNSLLTAQRRELPRPSLSEDNADRLPRPWGRRGGLPGWDRGHRVGVSFFSPRRQIRIPRHVTREPQTRLSRHASSTGSDRFAVWLGNASGTTAVRSFPPVLTTCTCILPARQTWPSHSSPASG